MIIAATLFKIYKRETMEFTGIAYTDKRKAISIVEILGKEKYVVVDIDKKQEE